ncbi:MAG: LysR family transcriptional regulator [bacterium]|nr:LysR family transcriptional regulator [bacterium]
MAIIRHGTVHGAAREIGLSQTGVTQRIRVLERELGCTLFVRSRRGMRPTAEGEALVRYAQRAGDLEGELLALVRRADPAAGVRVTITGPSSLMRSRVIPGMTAVLARHPGVALNFELDDHDAGLAALKTGQAQLAVLPRDDVVVELDAKPLRPSRQVLVGTGAWRGRKLREVVAAERIIDYNEGDDATLAFLARARLVQRRTPPAPPGQQSGRTRRTGRRRAGLHGARRRVRGPVAGCRPAREPVPEALAGPGSGAGLVPAPRNAQLFPRPDRLCVLTDTVS